MLHLAAGEYSGEWVNVVTGKHEDREVRPQRRRDESSCAEIRKRDCAAVGAKQKVASESKTPRAEV